MNRSSLLRSIFLLFLCLSLSCILVQGRLLESQHHDDDDEQQQQQQHHRELLFNDARLDWRQISRPLYGTKRSDDRFGASMDMNAAGTRIVVAATSESAEYVKCFQLNGDTWQQVGGDIVGPVASVAMNGAGNRIIIGQPARNYFQVYELNDGGTGNWQVLGGTITGPVIGEEFGTAVDMSDDGNRVIVGAPENDIRGGTRGAVYIYEFNSTNWNVMEQGILYGREPANRMGKAVAISGDGTRIAVDQYVRVYQYNSTAWVQEGNFRVSIGNEVQNDGRAATSLSLSQTGNIIAIAFDGYVAVFDYDATTDEWIQIGNNIEEEQDNDLQLGSVSLSADGLRVAIGDNRNTPRPRQGKFIGHARVFENANNQRRWIQLGKDLEGFEKRERFGTVVVMSDDGSKVVVSSPDEGRTRNTGGFVLEFAFESITPFQKWWQNFRRQRCPRFICS